jgi:hypothetical protein
LIAGVVFQAASAAAAVHTSVRTSVRTTAPAVDVVGDDVGDRFVGSGGLIVPGEVDPDTRWQVASCLGCHWRLSWPCVNLADVSVHISCLDYLRVCPSGQEFLRLYFSEDGGHIWRSLGLMCIDSGGPATVASVGREVRAEFERHQPARGLLPYLPVIFDSTQPGALPASEHLLNGLRVVLRPTATWIWDFGDGVSLRTLIPGSRYPEKAVSHAYSGGGSYRVRVITAWRASFTVDGLGPFAVEDPITQESSVRIQVGQARAVLVP